MLSWRVSSKCLSASKGSRIIVKRSVASANNEASKNFDIVIAGGGMVGTTLACTLGKNSKLSNKKILLLEVCKQKSFTLPVKYSNRVVSVNPGTFDLLNTIGAWKFIEKCRFRPVKRLQVWDAISSASITFGDPELTETVSYIVENDVLLAAVNEEVKKCQNVTVINEAKIKDYHLPEYHESCVEVKMENGTDYTCSLLLGCDGVNSQVRKAMQVHYLSWNYDQMGVVATIKLCEKINNSIAWQRFLPTGPIGILPLTEELCSLVWSTNPEHAKMLVKLSEEEFVDCLNEAIWKSYDHSSVIDQITKTFDNALRFLNCCTDTVRQFPPKIKAIEEGSRAAFPLGFGHATHYIGKGVALVGDAAHRIHPLAGQGVNLGFGDVACLNKVLGDAVYSGSKINDITYLKEYESERQKHNVPTMLACEGLHRLYNTDFAPLVILRSLGLQATHVLNPLKVMRMVVLSTLLAFSIKKSTSIECPRSDFQSKVQQNHTCETYMYLEDYEVHCFGRHLREVPADLNKTLNKLVVTDSLLRYVKKNSYQPYREKLQDVTLSGLPCLRVIEDGTFANIPNLRTIYIYNAPQLKFLHGLLKDVTATSFKSLRIINTGLHEVPDLFHLPSGNTMFLLDLDHNKIERLPSNSIKVTAQQVTINFNDIILIEDYAFNGSQIARLDIRANNRLHKLEEFAFAGLQNLRELDLSQTAIQSLPIEGLKELETLRIQETPSLQTIPSIYDLGNLKVARLTHHFHCCAFKYPEQHSPAKHAAYEKKMKDFCKQTRLHGLAQGWKRKRKRAVAYSHYIPSGYDKYPNLTLDPDLTNHMNKIISQVPGNQIHHFTVKPTLKPLRGKLIGHQEAKESDVATDDGVFHSSPTIINTTAVDAFCGNISFRRPDVECIPEPNALNPCEDIMGFSWLRISVWFVVILAVLGNMAVIVVILFSSTEINVSRFLISNLAFADLCMGLYLMLIASIDYHSVGTYFNFAFNWQYGIGCQIAGFLTVFAGHLSIFTLTVVTLERWFAITYAMHLTKRIRLTTAAKIMFGGWLYSILMAALPLFGVSNYSSTSICLPMEVHKLVDKAYLYSILILNGISFAIIVFCYAQIYLSLGYETRRASTKGEMTIAKKMALLVFVDFATYSPIAFFGFCALVGYPLIGVTQSKILLVFFYPLNACANPYLYALMTAQYRRDFYFVISRCGICKKKAERLRMSDSIPLSKPPSIHNNSNTIVGNHANACNNSNNNSQVGDTVL